ncbi:MAG: acyl-CoA dehydrogenase family protein [Myxococcales bacterium]|nr:acyl-CoA dehydrogenase family protein [Myxococcota bacterium]MDW8281125.1 acyl-CoA dehydrogenase family protein [Myxococcales bacterium]
MSDWFTTDRTLQATLRRDLDPEWLPHAEALLHRVADVAQGRVNELAWLADRHGPVLRTHDPLGERIDEVVYHPAYRDLERIAYDELQLVGMRYDGTDANLPGPAPQSLAWAALYLFAQGEVGLSLGLMLTDLVARLVLRYADEGLRRDLLPRLCARRGLPHTSGALLLNERLGGSDLQATQTTAVRDGSGWRLLGDKWHCSNVDAGVVLVLARVGGPDGPGGLGLFAVEPFLPDGRRNGLTIHRLKDKLGLRSLATGEVSFHGAWARMVAAPEEATRWLPEMLTSLRLGCAVLAVAIVRRALFEGLGWLAARQARGRSLLPEPLAIESLADLSAEGQGAFHLVFDAVRRLGLADLGAATSVDLRVLRLLALLCKYYTAKLAVWAASEGIELQGGNGYSEEFVTPRLLRDAQALPLLESPTNVCVLEALRALGRPGQGEALLHEAERKLVSVTAPKLRPLVEIVRRHLGRLERGMAQLFACSAEVAAHNGRLLTDALVQGWQVALALSEAERLDEEGAGGRDFLVAERLIARHIDRPALEALGPRHIDPLRLQVLLGERVAPVAEVA